MNRRQFFKAVVITLGLVPVLIVKALPKEKPLRKVCAEHQCRTFSVLPNGKTRMCRSGTIKVARAGIHLTPHELKQMMQNVSPVEGYHRYKAEYTIDIYGTEATYIVVDEEV